MISFSAGWIGNGAGALEGLLLGEFINGGLRYLGRVENNLAPPVVARVLSTLTPRAGSPFKDPIPEAHASFCEPALRIGVEFQDIT
jgi:hypothetical protein